MTELLILVLLKYGSVLLAASVATLLARKKSTAVRVATILAVAIATYFIMSEFVVPAAWRSMHSEPTSIRLM